MFRPLDDYILIRPLDRQMSTVIDVQLLNERENLGEVIAVGPGKCNKKGWRRPLDVNIGDIVRFGEFEFPTFYDGDIDKYLIIQEADIAGVVMDE